MALLDLGTLCTPTLCIGTIVALVIGWFVYSSLGAKPPVKFVVEPPKESQPGWKEGVILEKPALKDPLYPNTITCFDPATGRLIARIPAPTPADVKVAVEKARIAQKSWAKTSFAERRRVLQSLMTFLLDNQEEICRVSCRDTGKTMVDASLGEIIVTAEKLAYTMKHGEKVLADDYRDPGTMLKYKRAKVVYEPMGVVAAIVSWNYPFHNAIGPVISAIFAGNGIIVKCSEYVAWSTPYFEKIIKTCLEACGHNPDLVQFVTGFADVGEAVVTGGIDGITFIGSPQVGKIVMRTASANLTPCTLELGGKDCAIVCADADVNQVMSILMRGVFQNCGQNCIGIERILVAQEIYDNFVAEMKKRIEGLQLGCALDDGLAGGKQIDCGAMTMGTNFDHLESLINDAVSKGARLLLGGQRYKHPVYSSGQYFRPTLLVDVTPSMLITQHETFAPIMVVMKFRDSDDAIQLANSTPYGLGSSVFSANVKEADRIARGLRVAMVNINDFAVNYLCNLPFGGVGISGYGRFGGPEGLRNVCLAKSMTVDIFPKWIKTGIPPPVDYPVRKMRSSFGFSSALIDLIYNGKLGAKIGALTTILTAVTGLGDKGGKKTQ